MTKFNRISSPVPGIGRRSSSSTVVALPLAAATSAARALPKLKKVSANKLHRSAHGGEAECHCSSPEFEPINSATRVNDRPPCCRVHFDRSSLLRRTKNLRVREDRSFASYLRRGLWGRP